VRRRSLLALAALTLALSGCSLSKEAGTVEAETEPVIKGGGLGAASEGAFREGLAIELGGLDYKVFITRQLNPRDAEDIEFQIPSAKPGTLSYGVFLQVCNPAEEGEPKMSADEFEVKDAEDGKYKPVPLGRGNIFAYRPVRLPPGRCTPDERSASSYAPTGGKMLLFELPVDTAERRPVELEIAGPGGPLAFELDL
jgi:hypothetical protein